MNDGDRFVEKMIKIYRENHSFEDVYQFLDDLNNRKELGMESLYAYRVLTAWRRYLGRNLGNVGLTEIENDGYNFGVLIGIANERLDITELR